MTLQYDNMDPAIFSRRLNHYNYQYFQILIQIEIQQSCQKGLENRTPLQLFWKKFISITQISPVKSLTPHMRAQDPFTSIWILQ